MTRSEKENKHIPARLNLQNLKISPSQTGAANENGNGGGGGNSTSGKQDDTPASRGMVIFSVLFYLVAALVMVGSELYLQRQQAGCYRTFKLICWTSFVPDCFASRSWPINGS